MAVEETPTSYQQQQEQQQQQTDHHDYHQHFLIHNQPISKNSNWEKLVPNLNPKIDPRLHSTKKTIDDQNDLLRGFLKDPSSDPALHTPSPIPHEDEDLEDLKMIYSRVELPVQQAIQTLFSQLSFLTIQFSHLDHSSSTYSALPLYTPIAYSESSSPRLSSYNKISTGNYSIDFIPNNSQSLNLPSSSSHELFHNTFLTTSLTSPTLITSIDPPDQEPDQPVDLFHHSFISSPPHIVETSQVNHQETHDPNPSNASTITDTPKPVPAIQPNILHPNHPHPLHLLNLSQHLPSPPPPKQQQLLRIRCGSFSDSSSLARHRKTHSKT
ncbi:hypothetical protein Pst134EA_032634 [Puccinia striiformis f. sp. tritici]|uniref:uncharacterized protein n=1 Tax=Puccinia striiformis f. sp. tritici TaxID=168172 RepID=UPI002007FB72|nr:uncharacterized protein Pst134EA_032634 [Puccinia striiformis f. sp. tritici]KAH9440811.1 hypothetical protein Pst134EA_032634 [Puccinia striiformis f. sp. tritici]